MAKEHSKMTTRKWKHTSKSVNRLPIIIYDDSKFYSKCKRYLNVVGRGTYVATYKKGIFTIDFAATPGKLSTFGEHHAKNVSYRFFEFDASVQTNEHFQMPEAFKKSTAIDENACQFEDNKLIIDLTPKKKVKPTAKKQSSNSSLPAVKPVTEKQIEAALANALKQSNFNFQPPMNMDELSQTLADKLVEQVANQLSQHLANEIMDKLTRSDDFMNRLADTVGFKLATTMSTRFNRQDEALKAGFKELFSKMEKQITKNMFNMFKESGWLK